MPVAENTTGNSEIIGYEVRYTDNVTSSNTVLGNKDTIKNYKTFIDTFSTINPSVKYNTPLDGRVFVTFIGNTGINQAVKMAKNIDHANATDGLGNVTCVVIDSNNLSYDSVKDDLPKGHLWIPIKGEGSVEGMSSTINQLNQDIFKKSVEDFYKKEHIFDKYFKTDVSHIIYSSFGGGTGGNGFHVLTNMYKERGQGYIYNGALNTQFSKDTGNGVKVFMHLSKIANEQMNDGSVFPPVVNIYDNHISGKNSVDIVGQMQLLAMLVVCSGLNTNVDISEIHTRLYARDELKNRRVANARAGGMIYNTEVVLGKLYANQLTDTYDMIYVDDKDEGFIPKDVTLTSGREITLKKVILSEGLGLLGKQWSKENMASLQNTFKVAITDLVKKRTDSSNIELLTPDFDIDNNMLNAF